MNQHFDLAIPITRGVPPYQKHITDVHVNGVAQKKGTELSYEIDQVFVNYKECKGLLEAVYGPISEDDRFNDPIMAHIEKMDWATELHHTDLEQDKAA